MEIDITENDGRENIGTENNNILINLEYKIIFKYFRNFKTHCFNKDELMDIEFQRIRPNEKLPNESNNINFISECILKNLMDGVYEIYRDKICITYQEDFIKKMKKYLHKDISIEDSELDSFLLEVKAYNIEKLHKLNINKRKNINK